MKKSILIVDDDEVMLDILSRVLGKEYNVFTAANGYEALCIFNAEHPNLVISDLSMPRMDGLEFLKKTKSDRACKIFILSGQHSSALEEAIANGADEILEKPVSFKELLDLTKKYLDIKL